MFKSYKILVVDDDEIIRNMAENILKRAGYRVVTADSGEEGLKLFSSDPGSFALVIIDESMPNMSGQETLSKMRNIMPDIPCVISSGHALSESDIIPELRENCRIMGKPYKSKELRAMVYGISGESSGESDTDG